MMDPKSTEHPFLVWFAYMTKRRLITSRGSDLILNSIGAKRFALGVEDSRSSGHPVLGMNVYDTEAFQAIKWTAAGIVIGHINQDWVALSSPDIRPVGSDEPKPVPLRVWIPFPTRSLDAFQKNQSTILDLKRVKKGKGVAPIFEKTPFETLSLSVNNKWEKPS